MSKKNKNIRHKQSVKRKLSAQQDASRLGLDIEDDLIAIGVVLTHLSISHLSYMCINAINKLSKELVGVDIHLFSQHKMQPCVPPLCPVFGIHELVRWHDHPLITTSIETTIEALSSNASKIYYYVFDPDFIYERYYDSSYIQRAFCDSRVKIIVRHESHKQLIEEEFGIEVSDIIIDDFNIEKLIKLVVMET